MSIIISYLYPVTVPVLPHLGAFHLGVVATSTRKCSMQSAMNQGTEYCKWWKSKINVSGLKWNMSGCTKLGVMDVSA